MTCFYFKDMQDDRVSRESVQREEKSRAATTAKTTQANKRSSHWARKQPADSVPAAAVGSARRWSNPAMMLSPVLPVRSLSKSRGAAHVGCSFLNWAFTGTLAVLQSQGGATCCPLCFYVQAHRLFSPSSGPTKRAPETTHNTHNCTMGKNRPCWRECALAGIAQV